MENIELRFYYFDFGNLFVGSINPIWHTLSGIGLM